MRLLGRAILGVVVLAVLTGCATNFSPRPDGDQSILVLGRYRFDNPPGDVQRILETGSRIELLLRSTHDADAGTSYSLKRYRATDLLYTDELPTGTWEIYRMRFSDRSDDIERVITVTLQRPLRFTARAGFVNNMGTIRFYFPSKTTIGTEFEGDGDELEIFFRNSYIESEWNQFPWIPLTVSS